MQRRFFEPRALVNLGAGFEKPLDGGLPTALNRFVNAHASRLHDGRTLRVEKVHPSALELPLQFLKAVLPFELPLL